MKKLHSIILLSFISLIFSGCLIKDNSPSLIFTNETVGGSDYTVFSNYNKYAFKEEQPPFYFSANNKNLNCENGLCWLKGKDSFIYFNEEDSAKLLPYYEKKIKLTIEAYPGCSKDAETCDKVENISILNTKAINSMYLEGYCNRDNREFKSCFEEMKKLCEKTNGKPESTGIETCRPCPPEATCAAVCEPITVPGTVCKCSEPKNWSNDHGCI